MTIISVDPMQNSSEEWIPLIDCGLLDASNVDGCFHSPEAECEYDADDDHRIAFALRGKMPGVTRMTYSSPLEDSSLGFNKHKEPIVV
jgi:hypothetical protein